MSFSKYLSLVILFSLLFITVPAYKKQIFYTRFVDEDYNFTIGKYLTRGEVLYDDIITNHLPITHLVSGLLQARDKPDTVAALIEEHRIAIINWSAIWSIIIVLYFGIPGLIFALIYELTKNHLYGNLFLAETFVAYPLAFLIGLALFKKFPLKTSEMFLVGVLLTVCTLTLGPIWPGILFLCLVLLVKQFKNLKTPRLKVMSIIFFTLGSLSTFIVVLPYINVAGFFEYYILGNFSTMVPHSSTYWQNSLPQSFITPFISLMIKGSDDHLMLIRILSILLILDLAYVFFLKKFSRGLIIFILLGLFNIRFINPGEGHFNGFHLLPWYTALVTITSFLFIEQFKNRSFYLIKFLNIGLLIVALFLSFRYAQQNLFVEKDSKKEYEVLFSTHTKIGESIKNIKHPADTLFVNSDAWLVYWQSDTNHLPKLFGYYTWMSGIPKLHEKMHQAFRQTPPVYLYCEGCKNSEFGQYLGKYSEVKGYEEKQNLFNYTQF